MKGRGDRGKGIEILETRILVKAGIYRERMRGKNESSRLVPSIVGIYRNGFDTMHHVYRPFVGTRFDWIRKDETSTCASTPCVKISCSISLRSMHLSRLDASSSSLGCSATVVRSLLQIHPEILQGDSQLMRSIESMSDLG